LGPLFADLAEVRALGEDTLQLDLTRRSALMLEGLDVLVEDPESRAGTGPFRLTTSSSGAPELRRNDDYYGGKPIIEHIVVRTYDSTRAAWADMLRGEVDMLYEVGIDAIESLKPSNNVKVFTQQRSYAYVLLLNVHRPNLKDSSMRRRLNEGIDREALVAEALNGHGRPADGPVWPWHWAYGPELPKFEYRPAALKTLVTLTCLFADPSLERLALTVQQQLAAIGVELKLEFLPLDDWYARVQAGDFDLVLADANGGPTMIRPYWFWHTGGPFNWV
jgi:peptide/nickel transport system substrate-binding protein